MVDVGRTHTGTGTLLDENMHEQLTSPGIKPSSFCALQVASIGSWRLEQLLFYGCRSQDMLSHLTP